MPLQNDQQEINDFFYHLDICCRLVAEKFGNTGIDRWLNGNYIQLSHELLRRTGVQISASTLKRIFGKLKTTDRYYPQQATRDALAYYAGYKNWADLATKHPRVKQKDKAIGAVPEDDASPLSEKALPAMEIELPKTKPRNFNSYYFVAGAVFIGMVIFFITYRFSKENYITRLMPGSVTLSCSRAEGETPHSTTFRIAQAKNLKIDPEKFTVDFGDSKKPKQLVLGQSMTHFYEVPGRYYAVLSYNGQPCDTVSIYLKTTGWTATVTVQHDTTRVYPVEITRFQTSQNLEISAAEIYKAGVDTTHTFFVDFVNSTPLGINGDNFELSAFIVTSSARPGVRCSQADINVYGEKSQHKAIFIKPGCVNWSYLQFSEVKLDGEMEDLAFMGTDLTKGGWVTLSVVHKKVSLLINGKKIYSTAYNVNLGNIYGIKISFAGIGSIKDFRLKDLGTGKKISEGFFATN